MVIFVVTIHTLISLGLIGSVLLHSGKGAGLSSSMGGNVSSGTFGGTGVIEKNLDRFTIILGIMFVFTTIILVALV